MRKIKKLSRENLKSIKGGGYSNPNIGPDGNYYCSVGQGQLCQVAGCTPKCVDGPCSRISCIDLNP